MLMIFQSYLMKRHSECSRLGAEPVLSSAALAYYVGHTMHDNVHMCRVLQEVVE